MSTNRKHIHKIVRVQGRFTQVWRCAECKYTVTPAQDYYILASKSICWECGKPFVMDEDTMQMDFPSCARCRNPNIAPIADAMSSASETFPMNSSLEQDDIRKRLIELGVINK